ncbi:MAG: histidine kinase [Myxococcota bacterium]|nr:histidine kinase [Myxococcota bacterium]
MRSSESGVFLAVLAGLAWIVAGAPRIAEMAEPGPPDAAAMAWIALYAAFGICAALALRARSDRAALGWTLAESAIAIALLALGMPHFEGALLALVGAQARLVVPLRVALVWIALQAVPLFVAILPSHELLGALKATVEYTAFASFAAVLFDLRHAERARRLELSQIHAELLGTRALLAETARFAEQRRIGRELHDVVGHHLVALSMHLDRVGTDPSAIERARETLDAVRDDARELLAGMDATIDLGAAFRALAGATPAMRVRIEAEALEGIGPEPAWAVFRCVQEALTNAWKHGRAREVVVRCSIEGEQARVRIENDGDPIARAQGPGRGLRGMRERLAAIGGELAVEAEGRFALVLTIPRPR